MFRNFDMEAAMQTMIAIDDIFTWLVSGKEEYNPSDAILRNLDRNYLHYFLHTAPRLKNTAPPFPVVLRPAGGT